MNCQTTVGTSGWPRLQRTLSKFCLRHGANTFCICHRKAGTLLWVRCVTRAASNSPRRAREHTRINGSTTAWRKIESPMSALFGNLIRPLASSGDAGLGARGIVSCSQVLKLSPNTKIAGSTTLSLADALGLHCDTGRGTGELNQSKRLPRNETSDLIKELVAFGLYDRIHG